MSRKKTYVLIPEKKKPTINIYIGIIIVAFVLIPIVIMPLRYQIGAAFSTIINGIGGFSLIIGGVFMTFGVVGIFTRSRYWVKHIVVGVVLLWIGSWCTGLIIDFLGIPISGPGSTGSGSGYF
ncbi:hypothetical protein LCGC14_2006610 [marine sediment metagenome]|uniref:DNA translocase FtsK 4TM region domain-containing protein n=1 Tax=marine sediment metagenome TaxID=412755 RepID=A0A0F9F1R3_9ZZZZ